MFHSIPRVATLAVLGAVLVVGGAYAQNGNRSESRALLKQFESAFIDLSEQVRPSVVEISAEGSPDAERDRMDELFRFFRNEGGEGAPEPESDGEPERPQRGPRSTASGFIFDTLGHIVTNNHVVKEAASITVQLHDGTELPAEIIGQDPEADLAVIKIDPAGIELKPVQLGDSDGLQVGQFAVAMGSPSGLTGSFSYGHVTGLGRESLDLPDRELRFQNFIQTDAAINLGNSGGPLCNIDGEVIGVNVAIVYRANSIGFAIPINRAKNVVPQLLSRGKVIRGWLGVSVQDVDIMATSEGLEVSDFVDAHGLPDSDGSYIVGVTPDGPAESSGLQAEDVVRRINGIRIETSTDLINTISAIEPGDQATISVWRRGERVDLDVMIGEYPGRTAAIFGRPTLGMYLSRDYELPDVAMERMEVDEEPTDYFVAQVEPDSPADDAGIRAGDLVLEIAYEEVTTYDEFKRVIAEKAKPGKTILLKVWDIRDEEPRNVYLKIPADFTPAP